MSVVTAGFVGKRRSSQVGGTRAPLSKHAIVKGVPDCISRKRVVLTGTRVQNPRDRRSSHQVNLMTSAVGHLFSLREIVRRRRITE
jgi:hypothetical protein